MMSQQPAGLTDWIAFLGRAEIPVLAHTVRELERLHENEAQLNARAVADVVTDDPLMTVKLLRYMQMHKHRNQTHELVDVKQTLLMMGLDTFFREVPPTPIAEDMLQEHRAALVYLLHTVRRAQRSAYYAFDWALRLHDMHAEEVQVSALLTHMSEMLMWCFSPERMLEIQRLQAADRTMRSADAQNLVLGFAGLELQRQLTVAWRLPELLRNLTDPALARSTRVRNVMLAANLARHSAQGWHDAALPDDFDEIAALLHMNPNKVMALVKAGPSIT